VDTVILAAGKGERLDGISAPYHKPLIVVNGLPIIRHAVEHALLLGEDRIIVVVAPENATPIAHVLKDIDNLDMIVQRSPRGPGDALYTGLRLVNTTRVLILMGDNLSSQNDVREVVTAGTPAVGTRQLPAHEAGRFTFWDHNANEWREKVPILGSDEWSCWVGPLFVETEEMKMALETWVGPRGSEVPIGPLFNSFRDHFAMVPVETIDIGIPEALA
jgi:molybdopterin-guanine dinucleotide biosynthesis protein A